MFWPCKLTSLQFGFCCFPSCFSCRFSSVFCCGGKFASSVWLFQGYEICKTGKEEDTDIDTITVTARKSSAGTRVSHRYDFFSWENQWERFPPFSWRAKFVCQFPLANEGSRQSSWIPFSTQLAPLKTNRTALAVVLFLTEWLWIDIGQLVLATSNTIFYEAFA